MYKEKDMVVEMTQLTYAEIALTAIPSFQTESVDFIFSRKEFQM